MASQIPKTHKAAQFKEKGGPLVVEEVETKQPQEGEVLVKVLACGVCHTDAFIQGQVMGNPYPFIPGHEIIGDVVALGAGEKQWKVGDRVGGGWHGGHDGTCKQCKRGFNRACENAAINGITRTGGYQEYVPLRTEAVISIPRDVDPAAFAPQICAGLTVYNSMRQMNITPGETVAIQGLGGLGHMGLQYASKMGFRVVAISSSGSKEKFAKDLGALGYIDGSKEKPHEALMKMGGAAMIVVTAPNPDLIGELIGGLAPKGKLVVLSPCGDIPLNTASIITGGKSVHGWSSGQAHNSDSEETIEFAKLHKIDCMIEKFPLAKANEAYEHMMSGKVRFRAVLTFD